MKLFSCGNPNKINDRLIHIVHSCNSGVSAIVLKTGFILQRFIPDKKRKNSAIHHCIEQKLASKFLALSGNNIPMSCHVEKVKACASVEEIQSSNGKKSKTQGRRDSNYQLL